MIGTSFYAAVDRGTIGLLVLSMETGSSVVPPIIARSTMPLFEYSVGLNTIHCPTNTRFWCDSWAVVTIGIALRIPTRTH